MSEENPRDPVIDPPSYDVDGFCRAHHIARSHFYSMLQQGNGPRIIKLGRRTIISGEEAARWRRRMQAQSKQEATPGTHQ